MSKEQTPAVGYESNMTRKSGEVVTDGFKNSIRKISLDVDVLKDMINTGRGIENARTGDKKYMSFVVFATKDTNGQGLAVIKEHVSKK